MVDETNPGESAVIAAAVELALQTERSASALSEADKSAIAAGIYTSWRNAFLGGLPPPAFDQVEAASGSLVAAIAAQL